MLYLWSKFSCVFLLSKSKICKRYFPETSSLAYTAFSATEWTQILFIDPDPVQISLVMTDDPAMKFSKTFVTIVYTKSGLCLWKHGEISEIRIGTWRIQTEIEIAARLQITLEQVRYCVCTADMDKCVDTSRSFRTFWMLRTKQIEICWPVFHRLVVC